MFLYEHQTLTLLARRFEKNAGLGVVTLTGENATLMMCRLTYAQQCGSIKGKAKFARPYRGDNGTLTGMTLDVGAILNRMFGEIDKLESELSMVRQELLSRREI